jgi:hypothetical protein
MVLLEQRLQCSGNEKLVLGIQGGLCVSEFCENYLLISRWHVSLSRPSGPTIGEKIVIILLSPLAQSV